MIEKIVSGGQTGVDRAALDAALDLGLSYGGWCPKGRIDELGIIPNKYNNLVEISTCPTNDKDNYNARTKQNIIDSDGTLIIVPNIPLPNNITDGTLLTIDEVSSQKKPYLLINLSSFNEDTILECQAWIIENDICTLNIAGPRESSCQGIYEKSYNLLVILLPLLVSNSKSCLSTK